MQTHSKRVQLLRRAIAPNTHNGQKKYCAMGSKSAHSRLESVSEQREADPTPGVFATAPSPHPADERLTTMLLLLTAAIAVAADAPAPASPTEAAVSPAPPSGPSTIALVCAAAAEGDPELAASIARLGTKSDPAAADRLAEVAAAIAATGHCPTAALAPDTAVADRTPASAQLAGEQPAEAALAGTDSPSAPTPTPAEAAKAPAKTSAKTAAIKGRLEFGLGQSSGTTDSANANIAAALTSDAGGWQQKLAATLDYQDIEGIAANERYTANYDVRRTLSKQAFVSGLFSFESDRLSGFKRRTAQSLGFGAKLALAKSLSLDLSGGPSLRQVEWIGARGKEELLGARGSAALAWNIAPGVAFAATTSGIFEAANGTIEGQASLTGKIAGPLAMRIQLTARHETRSYPGIEPTTTTSRASIVYSF